MKDSSIQTEPQRPTLPDGRPSIFGAGPSSTGGGEGMDRQVDKPKWPPVKIAALAGGVLFLALIAWGLSTTAGGKKLNVERDKLTIATVHEGDFQEFMAVTGTVLPRSTIYLDAVEGGRIEELFVQEGAVVEAGQPLLRLSNNDLQLRVLNVETQRIEQKDRLQNTRFSMEQNALSLRQQLVEMDYQIQRLERLHSRQQELFNKKLIAAQDYEATRDELVYWNRRRDLTLAGYRQDSLRQVIQIRQMENAVRRLDDNFAVIEQSLDNLTLRAPVAGQLSALNAEIGELRTQGFRFGQIDVLDGFKVRAAIDEFYITRVQRGQRATGELAGQTYEMAVTRVYPEVRDGRFEVDLTFEGTPPSGIRRGQTLRFRLEMSDPAQAVMVPRGGFYQTTGGNWAYVLTSDGDEAVKRTIRLGRQNPQFFEVLEGLEAGDQVVTSSYDTYGDADRLLLK